METFRLMLHEGGSIDGELKMLKQPGAADPDSATERVEPTRRGSRAALDRFAASAATDVAPASPAPSNGQPAAATAAAGAEPIG